MILLSRTANNWWERSPNASNTTNFCNVNNNGNANNNNASNTRGVCFGFHILYGIKSDKVSSESSRNPYFYGRITCTRPSGKITPLM